MTKNWQCRQNKFWSIGFRPEVTSIIGGPAETEHCHQESFFLATLLSGTALAQALGCPRQYSAMQSAVRRALSQEKWQISFQIQNSLPNFQTENLVTLKLWSDVFYTKNNYLCVTVNLQWMLNMELTTVNLPW